jgi:serine/threonine protein phosphatase PrpC
MDLSWAQHEASQRGSFTTIASIEPAPGGLNATCVGDSAIVLLRDGDIVDAFPSPDPAHYSSVPDALGSSADHLAYGRELLEVCKWTIPLEPGAVDTVVLATDAVAVWLLSGDAAVHQKRLTAINSCNSAESWEALVHTERARGHMKTDDSTVMLIDVQVAA